jgi:cytochrome bd-type quinol oxidase subunit 1
VGTTLAPQWTARQAYIALGNLLTSAALAAEGIFAFFLESGFLAVLVFGWDRVSRKMHFFSTWMVFLGSVFSAVWIVPVLNVLAIANIPRAIHLSKPL